MLAIGASLGGLVTAVFGRNVAFVVNAASFFVSCVVHRRHDATTRRRPAGRAARAGSSSPASPISSKAFATSAASSHVAALMLVKAGWGLAGGILLLLTIFGQRVFPVGGSTAAGIGVLYGARGVGAALGPIMLRWILGQKPATLRRTIGPAYFVIGVFYVALSVAPGLLTAAACVLLRALRRLDPVGVQHRAAADGGAGRVPWPRLRGRARARDA